jgi:AsmA-like protein
MRANLPRSRFQYLAIALGAFGVSIAIVGLIALKSVPNMARRILIRDLQQRFHSTIEIGEIQVHGLIPLKIVARDITLRYQGRDDVPPLMSIERLSGSADLQSVLGRQWRVTTIHMDGLKIRIPPHSEAKGEPYVVSQAHPKLRLPPLEFTEITTDNALLEILPRQKDRKPHSFWIHHLTLRSIRRGEPAYFHAQLANEIPTGEIDSEGTFGPWDADQPGLTPVAANFEFANANLGQFHGLSGTLSSTGHYGGVLERLDVDGQAVVPNFGLSLSGKTVALKTHYVAVVDGTNGDTYLQSVEARFLRTTLKVNGEVADIPQTAQRKIVLTVTTTEARAEDLLQLVTKGTGVPLGGAVKLHAHLELPSGSRDVVDRLLLDGQFQITHAGFTNRETQARIDALSRRAQGKPEDEGISGVTSDIRGNLRVVQANAYFSALKFAVPGAAMSLSGSYGLKSEELDFRGKLELSSKLSQMTTGAASVLLRALNPFFKDGSGGSILPIKITGSRSNPSFGLDLRRRAKPA